MKKFLLVGFFIGFFCFVTYAFSTGYNNIILIGKSYLRFVGPIDANNQSIINAYRFCFIDGTCRTTWSGLGGGGSGGITQINQGTGIILNPNPIVETGTVSVNLSYLNSLYYPLSNPYNFVNSTYNSTYNTWAYNQTTPAINWVIAQNYLKQETDPLWSGNYSTVVFTTGSYANPSWITSLDWGKITNRNLNINWQGSLGWGNLTAFPSACVNQFVTGIGTSLSCNQVTNSYLATGVYSAITGIGTQTQNLNMGSNSIINANWVNATNVNATGWVNATRLGGMISCTQIDGGTDTDYCTDATGGGSGISFAGYNTTLASQSTTSNSYILASNLTLSLPATGFVNIECNILQTTNTTTNGFQYRVNLTGSASQLIVGEHYTSTTAQALCQSTTTSLACSPTSSSGTTIAPIRVWAFSQRTGAGLFTFEFRSEELNNMTTIERGSWCRYIVV